MSIDCRLAAVAGVVLLAGGCELFQQERRLPVPTAEQAATYYGEHRGLGEVRLAGNVVEVRIRQPREQLRRGGSLWARAGPYVHLFTPSTRDLFEAWPGVAAVRVITHAAEGDEVARAMLLRGDMNGLLWQRSLNLLGHALQEGTIRPRRLEELIQWGEDHTQYEYDPDYVAP